MNLSPTPSPQSRKRALLDAIQFHINQAEGALRELRGLVSDDSNDQPLAIFGNGEYAGVIEAKPRKEA